jgi:hypothetical protein
VPRASACERVLPSILRFPGRGSCRIDHPRSGRDRAGEAAFRRLVERAHSKPLATLSPIWPNALTRVSLLSVAGGSQKLIQ